MRALAISILLLLGSCRSTPDPALIETRPPDFAVAAAVLGPSDSVSDAPLPRSLRPARYVVDCDGVLRASVGAGSSPDTLPPQTRQLTHAQLDRLWTMARESTLFGPGAAAHIDNPQLAQPDPARPIAVLEATYAGTSAAARVPLDRSSPEALTAEELVDALAELAWVRN